MLWASTSGIELAFFNALPATKVTALMSRTETPMKNVSHYVVWVVLSLPACWLLWLWFSGDSTAHYLLLPSGKYSVRLTIVALAVTPLRLWFPQSISLVQLLKFRRSIGVSACGYAVLHTVFYLIDEGGFAGALGDIRDPEIIAGWIAMLVFVILGLTSNNWSMKKLGKRWKVVQRAAYLVVLLSFLHWFLLGHYQLSMLAHLLPLVLIQSIRVWVVFRGR